MSESILNSIKQMLSILNEDTAFDMELISHINNAFADLTHSGSGLNWYMIQDSSNTWNEFTENEGAQAQAKQYIFCKVRLLFDPPGNSFVVDSISKSKDEAYWRFYEILDQERINNNTN